MNDLVLFGCNNHVQTLLAKVLWLIGVCTKSEPWFMVSEFMEYGDLKSVLVKLKEKGQKLTPAELVNIDQHIAAGMLFLSSKQVYRHSTKHVLSVAEFICCPAANFELSISSLFTGTWLVEIV